MSKKERATAITRSNIEDAFWSYYCEMPMDKIRINAVMDRAGYNRGTFYQYFKSLEDVLTAIETDIYNGFMEQLELISTAQFTGAELLMGGIKILLDNKDKLAVLMGENGDGKFRAAIIDGTNEAIDRQLKAKIGDKLDLDNIYSYKYFVDFISNGLWGTLIKWADEQSEVDETLATRLSEYFEGVEKIAYDFCTNLLALGY